MSFDLMEDFELSSITDIFENKSIKVCFVCTGNTCRSPMAAAVLNQLGKNYNITAVSAGLYPNVGDAMSFHAVEALENKNIKVPDHYSRRIDEEIVRECDKIIGISENHAFILLQMFPFAASKIYNMPEDISDPYGGRLKDYEECLTQIISGIREMFKLYD
jgi:Protein-tyrosine-phosphatase